MNAPLRAGLIIGLILMAVMVLVVASRIRGVEENRRQQADLRVPVPRNLDRAGPRVAAMVSEHRARVEAAPHDDESWLTLGHVFNAIGEVKHAESCYRAASAVEPDNARAWHFRALMAARRSEFDQAIDLMDRSIRQDGRYAPSHRMRGDWLARLDRLDDAENAYRLAIDLAPADPSAHVGLARLFLQRGEAEQAIRTLEPLARPGMMNAEAVYFLLGSAYRRAGRGEDAAAALGHVQGRLEAVRWPAPWTDEVERYRVDDLSMLGQAQAMLMAGATQQAARLLEELRARNPDDASILSNLGSAYLAQHRFEDAVDVFNEVLRLQPRLPQAHFNLAQATFAQMSNAPRADHDALLESVLKHLDRALESNPGYAAAHGLRGDVLRQEGDLIGATEAYRQAARDRRTATRYLVLLGHTLMELNRFGEAIEAFREAHQGLPNDASILHALADAQARAGFNVEAARTRSRAEQLGPGGAPIISEQRPGPGRDRKPVVFI